MTQVTLKINGYAHALSCGPGEEDHLRSLAGAIDDRITAMKKAGVQGSEARMLVMAALMISDELSDARAEIARLGAAAAPDASVAETVRRLAARIDGVAQGLASREGLASRGQVESRAGSA